MNIHMSTRFLQLRNDFPNLRNFEIISLTTKKMFWPILYTVMTTVFAFLSLIFSEIKPIIDFGWMMTLGLITSFIITFTLLPTLLNFFSNNNIKIREDNDSKITSFFGKISIFRKNRQWSPKFPRNLGCGRRGLGFATSLTLFLVAGFNLSTAIVPCHLPHNLSQSPDLAPDDTLSSATGCALVAFKYPGRVVRWHGGCRAHRNAYTRFCLYAITERETDAAIHADTNTNAHEQTGNMRVVNAEPRHGSSQTRDRPALASSSRNVLRSGRPPSVLAATPLIQTERPCECAEL